MEDEYESFPAPICSKCKKKLRMPGAILFGPPYTYGRDVPPIEASIKDHLCGTCYFLLIEIWLND